MKAIKLNNETYKVHELRGSFVFYIDNKGKVKCIAANQVEVIETEEFAKSEVKVKKEKLNKANFQTEEEKRNNKYSKMTEEEYEEMRRKDRFGSVSF